MSERTGTVMLDPGSGHMDTCPPGEVCPSKASVELLNPKMNAGPRNQVHFPLYPPKEILKPDFH